MNQKVLKTPLSKRFCGSRYSYIYAIYSIKYKLCYIGQTNDRVGVIGRVNRHLDTHGTFRTYFENKIGFSLDEVDDLYIISEILTDLDLFNSTTSSYREGVEYIVKSELMKLLAKNKIFIQLIGNTRTISTVSLDYIKSEANKIAENIFNEIKKDYKIINKKKIEIRKIKY